MQRDDYDVIAYHAYDAQTEHLALQISTLTWQNNWPHAAVEQ
jgi:arabinan endo-1,5-alpha-L-arabinosidase